MTLAASSCISAGTAGLVAALVIGRREGYGTENMSPFDLSLAVIGTGLLWVGWFGFNGGSAPGANSRAVMATGGTAGLLEGAPRQVLIQLAGIGVTLAWTGVATVALLKLVEAFVPLRVSQQAERKGLDLTQHGEAMHP